MATKIFTLCFIATLIVLSASYGVVASGDYEQGLMGWVTARSGCRGTVAECLDGDGEFEMDSEANRRILATSNYISYGALQRNTVPCSRRGASYYNCRSGAQANPYTRGCSAITRCRS
ncbi:rapid alkalinization factor-like [Actinidia eriantha]|uniref:rapid alkalinization factor-like n=1 Tax=Actinidia eriantha TaxID=165200 RepID=UPI0025871174|nr:rapid alkalinization factor-like [Actinidia eriantha]